MEQDRKEKAPVPEEVRELAAAEDEEAADRDEAKVVDREEASAADRDKVVVAGNRKSEAVTRINRILPEKGT